MPTAEGNVFMSEGPTLDAREKIGNQIPVKYPESRTLWFNLKTLYLFTKSDFKTVIAPQSAFALAGALSRPYATSLDIGYIVGRVPHMLIWIWIHLLTENISNQRLQESILEDSVNKSWRPLPSGRISIQEARHLLRVLVPLALLTSLLFGSFTPSVTLMTFIWLYNDLDGGSAGPWQRNAINAAGLACFGWGASEVLTTEKYHDGESTAFSYWTALMAIIVTTTVHAQDFPDREGDKARGRKTMPLLYGETWARVSLAISVLVWSIVCPLFWHVEAPIVWVIMLCIGCIMSSLALFSRRQSTDELVWRLWCLWMTVIYVLPLFARL